MKKVTYFIIGAIFAVLGIWLLMAHFLSGNASAAETTSKLSTGVASFFVVAFAIALAVLMIWAAFEDHPWVVTIGVIVGLIYFVNQRFGFGSKFFAKIGGFISAPFTKLGLPGVWQTIFAIVFLLVAGALFASGYAAPTRSSKRSAK